MFHKDQPDDQRILADNLPIQIEEAMKEEVEVEEEEAETEEEEEEAEEVEEFQLQIQTTTSTTNPTAIKGKYNLSKLSHSLGKPTMSTNSSLNAIFTYDSTDTFMIQTKVALASYFHDAAVAQRNCLQPNIWTKTFWTQTHL